MDEFGPVVYDWHQAPPRSQFELTYIGLMQLYEMANTPRAYQREYIRYMNEHILAHIHTGKYNM